jgi:hypothetical protein
VAAAAAAAAAARRASPQAEGSCTATSNRQTYSCTRTGRSRSATSVSAGCSRQPRTTPSRRQVATVRPPCAPDLCSNAHLHETVVRAARVPCARTNREGAASGRLQQRGALQVHRTTWLQSVSTTSRERAPYFARVICANPIGPHSSPLLSSLRHTPLLLLHSHPPLLAPPPPPPPRHAAHPTLLGWAGLSSEAQVRLEGRRLEPRLCAVRDARAPLSLLRRR